MSAWKIFICHNQNAMSKSAEVIKHVIPAGQDVCTVLNITPLMWDRLQRDDKYMRPWLMRYLIDRFQVNPLFIYAGDQNITLPPK